ncbi:hypothetical protein VP01_1396g5 [Puccinia sorghi]|uniref:Small RNA 2'-O-methyltransferase n=1 Tax=Puccinia sorghi TaxID=27349 RepID=A0A0L6VL29_9BASI|nr:hypothetical protein VP01_1396g5 [Puccinia sorghi]
MLRHWATWVAEPIFSTQMGVAEPIFIPSLCLLFKNPGGSGSKQWDVPDPEPRGRMPLAYPGLRGPAPCVKANILLDADMSQDQWLPHEHVQSPFRFFPDLATQRRSFCLGFLKRERVKSVSNLSPPQIRRTKKVMIMSVGQSHGAECIFLLLKVLELGCGEGTLLGLLTQPASCVEEIPSESALEWLREEQAKAKDKGRKERLVEMVRVVRETPSPEDYQRDLHLELLMGLDLDPSSVQRVHETIQCTNQRDAQSTNTFFWRDLRWEPLRVELWSGDLAEKNERFTGVECVVMSEVIEHLWPAQLERCVPLIFGTYRPQWILITTPNHEFNRYMDQYSSPESRTRHRFLDPTRRTNRFFRDSDHKFEWSQLEFLRWSKDVSSRYGYDYEISGCGSYINYFHQSVSPEFSLPSSALAPPESPAEFFATQCVVFKRRSGYRSEEEGKTEGEADVGKDKGAHKLVAVEEYDVDTGLMEDEGRAASRVEILELAKQYLIGTGQSRVRLRELWYCQPRIARLSAGNILLLFLALADEQGWRLSILPDALLPYHHLTGIDALCLTWLNFPDPSSNTP